MTSPGQPGGVVYGRMEHRPWLSERPSDTDSWKKTSGLSKEVVASSVRRAANIDGREFEEVQRSEEHRVEGTDMEPLRLWDNLEEPASAIHLPSPW